MAETLLRLRIREPGAEGGRPNQKANPLILCNTLILRDFLLYYVGFLHILVSGFCKVATMPRQLRALRGLVRDGRLVRLGYGVYARAIVSRLSGEPLLYARNGLSGKLGVPWEPTESERAYNEGRSTQIPVNPVLRVKGRFSRRLKDKDRELVLVR
jgi:hypothetical protein